MRKKIRLFVFTLILSTVAILSYNIIIKINKKNAITNNIKTIPKFSFKNLNKVIFNNSSLKPDLPIVFLYFNSECHFCQYEAQSIAENINSLKNVQLLFISTESIEEIEMFSKTHLLNNIDNITFLYDDSDSFSKIFDATSTPHILIYGKNKNLIKSHKGQLNADGILKVINK